MARVLALLSVLSVAACGGESALVARGIGTGGHNNVGGDGGIDSASGGTGMIGTGGSSGTGGTPGLGGQGVGGGGPGTGGSSGTGGGADGGIVNPGGAVNGAACTTNSQCLYDHCVDKVCCESACTGTCYTCASTASPGMCVPAAADTDPRNECDDMGVASCKTTGVCNGSGACRMYAQGEVCDSTAACNATNSMVVMSSQCNGSGSCLPAMTQDCKGYLCSAATCGTSCTSDANCVTGAFCSAGVCVVPPVNLAGNGDVEYGSPLGWAPFGGAPALNLVSTSSAGFAHSGMYSVNVTSRSQPFQGPSYDMPTGVGRYNITAYGMQQTDVTLTGILQIAVTCATTQQYVTIQTAGFGVAMPMGTWIQFYGPVDFSTLPADCLPTATPPGIIKRAQVYLNSQAGTPTANPDLYMDDIVIQSSDGHNLVGNYNFETAVAAGWAMVGTGSLAVSATIANGGTHSLGVTSRGTTGSGPSFLLPLGTAKYSLTFHVYHNGTMSHTLSLQPTYTCLGGSLAMAPAIVGSAPVAGAVWTTLTGTVTMPPPNAPAGCKMIQAEVHVQQETGTCGATECPDIYVDDITVSSATP